MINKAILFLGFLIIFADAFGQMNPYYPKVSNGTLKHIENFPSKYVSPRNVDIWLPEGYDENEKYAVLYMQDGQMLFDSTITWDKQEWRVDETMSKLLKENKIRKTIVVGIWNTKDRQSEYFPQKPFDSLPSSFSDSLLNNVKVYGQIPLFPTPVQSDNYLKFLVKELKPFIDMNYSTYTDAENTFIAGSSMGGLISIYGICEYPDIFGGAACLSTHWTGIYTDQNNPIPGRIIEYLKENLPEPATHKIYFDYGTETLDTLYEKYQIQVDSVMISKGYTNKNWITLKFEGENHSERSWAKRLDIPLVFLLRNEIRLENEY